MAIAPYYPGPNDIIIGGPNGRNYNCQVRDISGRPITWTVWGTIMLTHGYDSGNGWTYTVRYGWYPTQVLWMYFNPSYFTLSLNINGIPCEYMAGNNYADLTMGSANIYWMFTNTTSVTLPYNHQISGDVRVVANPDNGFYDFNYSGRFSNSGGGPGVTPPSPKPSPPSGLYFNSPSSITSTSAYVDMGYTADSSQDSYYHMGFYDVNGGYYRANPARSGRDGNLTYYRTTVSGLSPESTYVWNCKSLHDNEVVGSTVNRTFTTLSQDKIYVNLNGTWRLGYAYVNTGGTWRRGKQAYVKAGTTWVRARDL